MKVGDEIRIGDPIFTLHGDDIELLNLAAPRLKTTATISLQKPVKPSLILMTLT